MCLLLDTNPRYWGEYVSAQNIQDDEKPMSVTQVLDQILLFVNAFLMTKGNNRVVAIGSNSFQRCVVSRFWLIVLVVVASGVPEAAY